MKGFLLAGGRGERLRPLTDRLPKCLVPINGQPLLAIWLDLCEREGISHVMMNVSHHVDAVERFLETRRGRAVDVTLVQESAPIGSAATVRSKRAFVAGEESFWIFYADNLTCARLRPMRAIHDSHAEPMTVGLFSTEDPRSAGIVELDGHNRIVSFEEKPANPRGELANAGIYLARQALFEWIPSTGGIVDFGLDVLPALAGRAFGYRIPEFLADIGTPDRLVQASAAWQAMELNHR
jgi:mannose-1-phosphate guanylyltransferase